jgi:hypothetical protein
MRDRIVTRDTSTLFRKKEEFGAWRADFTGVMGEIKRPSNTFCLMKSCKESKHGDEKPRETVAQAVRQRCRV